MNEKEEKYITRCIKCGKKNGELETVEYNEELKTVEYRG